MTKTGKNWFTRGQFNKTFTSVAIVFNEIDPSIINPYRMLQNTVCIKLVSCIGFLSVLPKSQFKWVNSLLLPNPSESFFFCFSE